MSREFIVDTKNYKKVKKFLKREGLDVDCFLASDITAANVTIKNKLSDFKEEMNMQDLMEEDVEQIVKDYCRTVKSESYEEQKYQESLENDAWRRAKNKHENDQKVSAFRDALDARSALSAAILKEGYKKDPATFSNQEEKEVDEVTKNMKYTIINDDDINDLGTKLTISDMTPRPKSIGHFLSSEPRIGGRTRRHRKKTKKNKRTKKRKSNRRKKTRN